MYLGFAEQEEIKQTKGVRPSPFKVPTINTEASTSLPKFVAVQQRLQEPSLITTWLLRHKDAELQTTSFLQSYREGGDYLNRYFQKVTLT